MASEAVEIGCLTMRIVFLVVLALFFVTMTIVLFPVLCLVWLIIPFLFI